MFGHTRSVGRTYTYPPRTPRAAAAAHAQAREATNEQRTDGRTPNISTFLSTHQTHFPSVFPSQTQPHAQPRQTMSTNAVKRGKALANAATTASGPQPSNPGAQGKGKEPASSAARADEEATAESPGQNARLTARDGERGTLLFPSGSRGPQATPATSAPVLPPAPTPAPPTSSRPPVPEEFAADGDAWSIGFIEGNTSDVTLQTAWDANEKYGYNRLAFACGFNAGRDNRAKNGNSARRASLAGLTTPAVRARANFSNPLPGRAAVARAPGSPQALANA